jgi:hypothetical protein
VARDLLSPAEMGRASLPLIFTLALLVIAIASPFAPNPGKIDREIAASIRDHCQLPAPCRMTMEQLIPGDWDTFVEDSPRVKVISSRDPQARQPANALYLRRQIALLRDRAVIRQESEQTGVDQRLDGEVVFSALADGSSSNVAVSPRAVFRIEAVDTPGDPKTLLSFSGTYYLLTQE